MKMTVFLTLIAFSSIADPKPPASRAQNVPQKAPVVEQWLSPARRAQLKAITSRQYITAKRDIGKGMEELHWTNGARSWVTTQAVTRVIGAKATNGWQKKLDVEKAKTEDIIESVRKMSERGNATKKELIEIIEKAERQEAKKQRKASNYGNR